MGIWGQRPVVDHRDRETETKRTERMSVFVLFLSLLLSASGLEQRRRDEIRLLRRFMLLCPGSVPKSMSKPQKEQHVDLDCADCFCHDSNKSELICLNASSKHTLAKVCAAEFAHPKATERSCDLKLLTAKIQSPAFR